MVRCSGPPLETHPGLTAGAHTRASRGCRCRRRPAVAPGDSPLSQFSPQLPACSPQPHASSLAAGPDPSLSPSSFLLGLLSVPPSVPSALLFCTSEGSLFSGPPWPPVPGPCPSRRLLPEPPPPGSSWPSSGLPVLFPDDWILRMTGLCPGGPGEAQE